MTAREILDRVKALLLTPKQELPRTMAQPGELRSVLIPYVLVLAALRPLANFVSVGLLGSYHPPTRFFNLTVDGFYVRAPLAALGTSLLSYVLQVGAFLLYAV